MEEGRIVRTGKLIKIGGLNIGIALVDTVLFSPGLLGLQIGGGNALITAFGATTIVMSIIVFLTGNYRLIVKKEKTVRTNEIKTPGDCLEALGQYHNKKVFKEDIDIIRAQIERFLNKKETIGDILLQKFTRSEMSFSKFDGAISDVEDVFFINIISILNKLNAFDNEDYDNIRKSSSSKKFSEEFIQSKVSIYNEYISFVKNAVEDNEEILLKLDKLLLEISKLNSLEEGEIETMSAMKEIDDLINKTKLYK